MMKRLPRMTWPMPRMAKAVPYLSYVVVGHTPDRGSR